MKILLALLGVLLMAVPVSAGKVPVLLENGWTFDRFSARNGPVVQQSDEQYPETPRFSPEWERYVTNPYGLGCQWDVDESWDVTELGAVAAGMSVSATFCFVADHNPIVRTINGQTAAWSGNRGAFGAQLTTKSADFTVTVSWPAQGRTFTLLPRWNADMRTYVYGPWCGAAVYKPTDAALGYIAGSNGSVHPDSVEGRGVVSPIVLTVTNSGSRNANDPKLFAERIAVWQSNTQTCNRDRFMASTRNNDYPFWWIDNRNEP